MLSYKHVPWHVLLPLPGMFLHSSFLPFPSPLAFFSEAFLYLLRQNLPSLLWEPIFTIHISSFNIIFAIFCLCVSVSPCRLNSLRVGIFHLFIFVSLIPSRVLRALYIFTKHSMKGLRCVEREKRKSSEVSVLLFVRWLVKCWDSEKEQCWKWNRFARKMNSVLLNIFNTMPCEHRPVELIQQAAKIWLWTTGKEKGLV